MIVSQNSHILMNLLNFAFKVTYQLRNLPVIWDEIKLLCHISGTSSRYIFVKFVFTVKFDNLVG